MLDVARKYAGKSQTGDTESKLADLPKSMVKNKVKEENESNAKEPRKDEATSEIESLNSVKSLTESIDKLSIDTPGDNNEENVYQGRGPIGGLPVYSEQTICNGTPVRPMCNNMLPQLPYQKATMKGNRRRTLDDAEIQPNKFFRPPADYGDFNTQLQQQGFQFANQCNFTGCFTGTNDLSQGMAQPVMNNQQFGVNGKQNLVQSPLLSELDLPANNNFIADDLLDEIDSRPLPILGNMPHTTTTINVSQPYVQSGHVHESQLSPGMTLPVGYTGIATPSPANTSGYGSPGQPQLDENDFIDNDERFGDVLAFIEADTHLDEMKKNEQRQVSVSGQQYVLPPGADGPPLLDQNKLTPTTTSHSPNTVQEPVVDVPKISQMSGQMLSPPLPYPVTTVNATTQQQTVQQLQPNPNVIYLIVQSNPSLQTQEKPAQQFKPILPKPPETPAASISAEGNPNGSKTGAAMSSSRNMHSIRTRAQSNAQAPPQNKKLENARRKVAAISRDDLTKSDNDGDTYLHITVCRKDKYMVQALLERLHEEKLESLIDQTNQRYQTPLYLAVIGNQPAIVAMFISYQANVNSLAQNCSSDGRKPEVKSAIHVAASQGFNYHKTLVELLKAKDISINIGNNYGQTALHCAILAHGSGVDSIEIIRTLIRAGADASAQDKKRGKTPLMYAIEKTSLQLVDTILTIVHPDKVKSVIKAQDLNGKSCLEIAKSLKGSLEMDIWNRLWDCLQSVVPDTTTSRKEFNQ